MTSRPKMSPFPNNIWGLKPHFLLLSSKLTKFHLLWPLHHCSTLSLHLSSSARPSQMTLLKAETVSLPHLLCSIWPKRGGHHVTYIIYHSFICLNICLSNRGLELEGLSLCLLVSRRDSWDWKRNLGNRISRKLRLRPLRRPREPRSRSPHPLPTLFYRRHTLLPLSLYFPSLQSFDFRKSIH